MKKLLVSPCVLWGLIIALVVALSVVIFKAIPSEDSPMGFVLPPGDAILGQEVFVDLGCVGCHTVNGVVFDSALTENQSMTVPLGGHVAIAKTYGQLVTGIIHPSESIRKGNPDFVQPDGSSLMPHYRKDMTVEELAHLVHFLSEHYSMAAPDYTNYYYPLYW